MNGFFEGAIIGFLIGSLAVATLAHTREVRLAEKIHDAQEQAETLRGMVIEMSVLKGGE